MWPRPAMPSEVKTGWRIKPDSMCRHPAGTVAPARDFGSGRVRLAAALAQQQLEVLAQRQFHVGLGLREAIRPDADSHFFGAAVPAFVIQPELAFDTEAGSHPERDSMVRHLLPPKETTGGIMPQLMATRAAAKMGCRLWLARCWPAWPPNGIGGVNHQFCRPSVAAGYRTAWPQQGEAVRFARRRCPSCPCPGPVFPDVYGMRGIPPMGHSQTAHYP